MYFSAFGQEQSLTSNETKVITLLHACKDSDENWTLY